MFFDEVDALKSDFVAVKNEFKLLKEVDMKDFKASLITKLDEALTMSESKIRHYAKLTIEKNVKSLKDETRKLVQFPKANDQLIQFINSLNDQLRKQADRLESHSIWLGLLEAKVQTGSQKEAKEVV